MQNIIETFLAKSLTYNEYRSLVRGLLKEGKSTGITQNEDLFHYSELNETRMNRLDKTLSVLETIQERLSNLENEFILLTLTEGWCGDAAQILPILNKISETSDKIDLKLVLRDENEELMNLFLTNGSKSIPKVILIEKSSREVVGSWGPRPEAARKLIADYKEKNGVVDEPIKIELQKWYLKDKGESTQLEFLQILEEKQLVK
ncbi:MAG: thioredoxin family protein [Flavobacteriaceae bacterium]|nr:thioredoxin family protein [Flavobacteriaceae bacterium]